MPRKSSDMSDKNAPRPEPKLLRAAEAGNVQLVQEVIEEARRNGRKTEHLLAVGLLRSCEKGHANVARYLILQGAKTTFVTGNKVPPLLRAIEYGHIEIVQLLIEHGTDIEVTDKKGRTALMTAAWKNHHSLVRLLISKGSKLCSTDLESRNVLHNLAADKRCPECDAVVDLLLNTDLDFEAQDGLGRTALHWTAVTGNKALANKLLSRQQSRPFNINACDMRMKTALHFAASHNRIEMVRVLLEHRADVGARSDGYWTPLHNACERGSVELVELLIGADADINCTLLNGRTPLHVAAESGNAEVARCLLQRPGIKRNVKDRFGDTPLLRAAQTGFAGKTDIIELLAPWNHVDPLSSDALDASKAFKATIVDFGNYHNGNKVTRRSVYELLYARDQKDSNKHAVSTLPAKIKATEFRWIHLPANNIAWCDALLTKRFIEEGATDVEGFKALERSFGHQHRGQQHHSRFMRPLCQVERRAPVDLERQGLQQDNTSAVVLNGPVSITKEPDVLPSMPEDPIPTAIENGSGIVVAAPDTTNMLPTKGRPMHEGASTVSGPLKPGMRHRGGRKPPHLRTHSRSASVKRGSDARASNNIYLFMPYLHFETNKRRHEMQEVIKGMARPALRTNISNDEKLIRAHLTASSSVLHIRRTLDQFFYHNIDTQLRDNDQVVYRYQKRTLMHDEASFDPKVVMVDQLWIWILGRDLIVTSFPERWRQPNNDPLNVLEGCVQDINSKTREPVQSVYELAMLIAGRCFGTFDRHRKGEDDFQLVDMFEASIGKAMDTETNLFQEFSIASRQASAWLQQHQRPNRLARNLNEAQRQLEHQVHASKQEVLKFDDPDHEPLFVDKLLDIGQETDLLTEIKDIRDELMIMRIILEHQEQVLPDLRDAIQSIYKEERSNAQLRKVEKRFDEHLKVIHNPMKDIERMDKQCERIYKSIRDLLDLKQKHANAFEARFARDQASGTARQGQTIMVFTIVTVVFLPLTFIAAFFTMNISNFPHNANGNPEVSLSYVCRYVFGIGIAISIPCVIIALSVDDIGHLFREFVRWLRVKWWKVRKSNDPDAERQLELLAMRRMSVAKSTRRSVEVEWLGKAPQPYRSLDIERGIVNGRSWRTGKSLDAAR